MCNRAGGLIARVLESYGMSTVNLSLNREISAKVGAPRSLYLRFPYGAALGEPGNVDQQRTILKDMLYALQSIEEPGTIIDLPYRWRREKYNPVTFEVHNEG
jgi:hypothetical protein